MMANGDPLLVGHKTESSSVTWLTAKPEPFGGFSVFRASDDTERRFDRAVDGIHGVGSAQAETFNGGSGVVGFGATPALRRPCPAPRNSRQ
jgi:hypothetical protein